MFFDQHVIDSFIASKKSSIIKFEEIERVSADCGVSWKDGEIKIAAAEMYDLKEGQVKSLAIFQNNLLNLIQLYTTLQFKIHQSDGLILYQSNWFHRIQLDYEAKIAQVFYEMVRNLLAVLKMNHNSHQNHQPISSTTFNEFISGDPEKTLSVVPSRELACKLGISDQKLRREIYLARQRVLKSREKGKSKDAYVRYFDDFLDANDCIVVNTCASPPSSTIHSENEETTTTDEEMITTTMSEETDGWTSIETWLKSDMFEDTAQ